MEILRSIVGIGALLAIAYALSVNRKYIKIRTVLAALLVQCAIGAFILFVPVGRQFLGAAATVVNKVIDFGNAGVGFVFGGLVSDKMFELFGGDGFIFGFRVLGIIIYVTALISVLYYLGIMKIFVSALGAILRRVLGVSRLESFAAVSNIFLSQSDMPALIKPFVKRLGSSEFFAVMSSGMASVSGSVLAGYAGLGVKMEYLLAASFMAVPGGLLFAKIIWPSTDNNSIAIDNLEFDEQRPANVIEAAASGVSVGLSIAMNVGAMLIAFIGIIALLNGMFSICAGWFGYPGFTIEQLLGIIFSPLAWLIGVPWEEASIAGNFIGQKMILNEFVAYFSLAPYLKAPAEVAAAGLAVLDPRTLAIVSFALCGFANFASIGILTGGFGAIAPERRSEVARMGLRVVAAGSLSNLTSATIAGIFLSL